MANENLNTFWAELIVEELIRCGIDYFCISPGSRSTPLVVAAARNKNAKTIVCIDERNSAFHALGVTRASRRPAAVITTSGTAAANLYPAIIEASNDNIPMVVLTADRPHELVDTGSNQTIIQPNMFAAFTRWQFDLPCPDELVPPEMLLTTIDQAVYRSKSGSPGPVHINCRYRKPLEPTPTKIDESYIKNIKNWTKSNKPFSTYSPPAITASADAISDLASIIDQTNRGMIMVGKLNSDQQRRSVLKLIDKLNWPVYADITSGLRLTDCQTNIIRYFDQELLSDDFNKRVKPSTVLHIGHRTTSKRIGLFFDDHRPDNYIVIKPAPERYDPVHAVTMHIQADIAEACKTLHEKIAPQKQNDYADFFVQKAKHVDTLIEENISSTDLLSEPFIAREISKNIPDGSDLFLSSSMPIRDMDLYSITGRKNITVAANRGVSGIDGVISTASGFAAAKETLTTLLIGDLAFIHDINALAVLKSLKVPVIAIVVNNHGGGIFHFLPISQSKDVFEEFFAASHDFSFEGVTSTFGLDYYKANDKPGFTRSYQAALQKAVPAVIEVATDRDANLKLRKTIKNQILKILQE